MHNNYYFLRHLSADLAKQIPGFVFNSCFSQSKNELILQFLKGEEEFNIKAHLQPDFCCLFFPWELSRARRNSVNLFEAGMGLEVTEVIQFKNERSFLIRLQNNMGLLFKMHGNRSNILLMDGDEPSALFNNKLVKDWYIRCSTLDRDINVKKGIFLETGGNYRKLYPTLGKLVESYLQEKGYTTMEPDEQWELLEETVAKLESPPSFRLIEYQGQPAISLLELGEELASFTAPIEAINRFFLTYTREYTLELEKQAILQQLSKSIKSGYNYLSKTGDKLYELQNSAKNRELADILMANLHAIPTGATEATLFDFYHDRSITIKLKKELSPQKNAENLYRKAKNQQVEEQYLQENIRKKEELVLGLESHLEKIKKIESLKKLRSYLKEAALTENFKEKTEVLPYREYEFDGFAIWVGKGAAQNDALLRYHAHKDDLWLHAKDVPGSHVILKRQSGKNFSISVKEKAASLAAWYSKRKNDTLCPVICTSRKWVRKRKGSAAGAVMVDKEEEVLLVPPASFGE